MDIFLGNSMGRFLRSFLDVLRSVKLTWPVNTMALASQTESFLDSRTISYKPVVGRERGMIGLKDRLDKLPRFFSQRVAHHLVAAGSLHDASLPNGLKMSTECTLAELQRIRRKGRNVYRNGTSRMAWADEALRNEARQEKHSRGDIAREIRRIRKEEWA